MTDTTAPAKSNFERLSALDVSKYVEKKRITDKVSLTYLSWAWAVDQLLRADPTASWSYGEPMKFGESLMVLCTVTAFGQPRTMQLPVMDHTNKAIKNPDAFAVNTAMQRCLVKAIALHGIGLYIYAGEDAPRADDPEITAEESEALTMLREQSLEGSAALEKAWGGLGGGKTAEGRVMRHSLAGHLQSLKEAAAIADGSTGAV